MLGWDVRNVEGYNGMIKGETARKHTRRLRRIERKRGGRRGPIEINQEVLRRI